MPDYLLYWKDFWRDVAQEPGSINYSWHTARKSFFDFVQPGESLGLRIDTIWSACSMALGRTNSGPTKASPPRSGSPIPNPWRCTEQ